MEHTKVLEGKEALVYLAAVCRAIAEEAKAAGDPRWETAQRQAEQLETRIKELEEKPVAQVIQAKVGYAGAKSHT